MKLSHAALLAGGAYLGARLARSLLRPSLDWSGKVVLITGGSRGLGLVLARELVDRGARVAVCARDAEALERARAELQARGSRGSAVALAYACDVRDEAAVAALVGRIARDLGPVEVLFNNAGIISMGPVEETTLADFEDSVATHLYGAVNCTRAVLPGMLRAGGGRIVNISSIGGKIPVPHLSAYCAGKFALTGYSGALRAELGRRGVGVTTVCPFVMRTGSQVNALFKGRHRDEFTWFMLAGSIAPFSVPAPDAARRIIAAVERNGAEVLVGVEAAVGARLYGACPRAVSALLGLAARLLPRPGGIGSAQERGLESRTRWSTIAPTRPVYRAALDHNEVAGERRAEVVRILHGSRRAAAATVRTAH
jgi:NAD(P)-dependent dehydrogenase (short-subunit alcohol dehydrogenase family)